MKLGKAMIGCSALAALTLAFLARGDSRFHGLRGTYAFSGGGVCIISPSGFSADLVPLGTSFVNSFSVQGLRTFNGDGTGTASARVVSLVGAVNAADTSAQFTYAVAADGTVTIEDGPQSIVFVTGQRAGQQDRVTGIPPFVGRLSIDGTSLTVGTFIPAIETVARVLPAPEVVESMRVCHRALNGIQISDN